MSTFTEPARAGAFLLSEGNGSISRAKIVLAAGLALAAGTVLAKQTADGKYVAYNNTPEDPATGSEVAVAILYAPVEAGVGDRQAVAIVCMAEANAAALTGLDDSARADLAAHHIVCR